MEAAYKPTVVGDLDTQNFEKFSEVSVMIIDALKLRVLNRGKAVENDWTVAILNSWFST